MEALQGRNKYSASETQEAIQMLNQTLEKFKTDPSLEMKGKALIDALIANKLREQLDLTIERTTGQGYQALKNRYGALKSIESDVTRKANQIASKKGKPPITFSDVYTGYHALKGILAAEPAATAAAVGMGGLYKGVSFIWDRISDPDRMIKNMFENVEKLNTKRGAIGTDSMYSKISQHIDDIINTYKSDKKLVSLNAIAESVQNDNIGMPLLKPKDYTGQGARIPNKLKGVESGVDVRPAWQIKQEADAVAREANINAIIDKHKVMQKLSDAGSTKAKVYLKTNEKAFDIAWKAKGTGDIKIDKGFSSSDIMPNKEAPLLPSQRATLQNRTMPVVEKSNVPTGFLTPEETFQRNMTANTQSVLLDKTRRANLNAILKK